MLKRVLMCRPDYFGVFDRYNAHMNKSLKKSRGINPVNREVAISQWLNLTSALSLAGLELNFIEPQEGLPDMVFTANAGLIFGNQIILSNFFPEKRREEVRFFTAWFKDHGYFYRTLPAGMFFEGCGDILFLGDELIGGYGFRSDELGVRTAAEMIEKEPVLLKLIDEQYYHLDTCFCPARDDLILFHPRAFDYESRKKIDNLPAELIDVSSYDARRFVCNAVPIYKNGWRLITTPMSKKLKTRLEKRGIEIIETNLSEFLKSGGAARCLTLFI